MEEHRITTRQRVLKAGTIEFGGGAISCMVRNISATGAALEVTSQLGIPAQFTLVTEGNHAELEPAMTAAVLAATNRLRDRLAHPR